MKQYPPVVRPKLVAAVQSPSDVVSSHYNNGDVIVVFRDGSAARGIHYASGKHVWELYLPAPDYSALFERTTSTTDTEG